MPPMIAPGTFVIFPGPLTPSAMPRMVTAPPFVTYTQPELPERSAVPSTRITPSGKKNYKGR